MNTRVTTPIDQTDLSYALEELIESARYHDMSDDEIEYTLNTYVNALRYDRI